MRKVQLVLQDDAHSPFATTPAHMQDKRRTAFYFTEYTEKRISKATS